MVGLPQRLHAVDATIVYRLRLGDAPATHVPDAFDAAWLSADDVLSLSSDPSLELRAALAGSIERGEASCLAAHAGESVSGYLWFSARGTRVPGALNSGGSRFRGIALALPADVRYLYKVFVVPAARGSGLAAALIGAAVDAFGNDGTRRIVTTTDRANVAFQRTVERCGFEAVGSAVERRVFGMHRFALPDAIDGDIALVAG